MFSASSQVICCHLPSPLFPSCFKGYFKRSGWLRYSREARPLMHSAHSLMALSGSPSTLTGLSSTRCINTPQLSKQSPQVLLIVFSVPTVNLLSLRRHAGALDRARLLLHPLIWERHSNCSPAPVTPLRSADQARGQRVWAQQVSR